MIELWMLFALSGHVLNAAAFLIDKQLLTHTWKKSATYATLISVPSLLLVFALPWIAIPALEFVVVCLISGAAFTGAVWSFFEALKRGSIGFVVPVVGVAIPFLALIAERVLLRASFHPQQLFGLLVLLVSLWLITHHPSKKRSAQPIGLALLAAGLFTLSSVLVKGAYAVHGFASPFILSRLGAGFAGLMLFCAIRAVRRELRAISRLKKSNAAPLGLTLVGQTSGVAAYVLIQLAIVSGSVAIVNALQAVQYVCINLFALYKERHEHEMTSRALTALIVRTIIGVVGIGIGLYSLSL